MSTELGGSPSSSDALGRGDATTGEVPAPVAGLGMGSGVVEISGTARTYCVLRSNGEVWCWGDNWNGQVGNGSVQNTAPTPVKVPLPGAASSVATGNGHSCAAVGADFYCWGLNSYGQLGRGAVSAASGTPAKVLVQGVPTPAKPAAKPAIANMRGLVRIPRTRRVSIGTVRCPKGAGACRVTLPRSVIVRFAGKRYVVAVPRMANVRAGRTAKVFVVLPNPLYQSLGRRTVRVSVRVVATNTSGRTTRVVAATLRR